MRTVLVTGASRGLGLAIVEELLSQNFHVIGLARTLTPAFEALSVSLPLHFLAYDLHDTAGIPKLMSRVNRQFGPLYGLVNNAAIGKDGLLATQHSVDIAQLLRVNLEAPITLSKYASRAMINARCGRIVNISSIIAQTGFNGLSVYGATKAGLEGFTRSLSRELGRANITVNCVAPGYMETEMTQGLAGEKLTSVRRRAPLGLPEVKDVAPMVAFLLSDAAAKITGAVMTVDGGSTA